MAESYLEEIALEQITLRLHKRSGLPGGVFDEQPPEGRVYSRHNPAVYGRWIYDWAIDHLKIDWGAERLKDWINGVYGEDIDEFQLRNLVGGSARPDLTVVQLRRVKGFTIADCRIPENYRLLEVQEPKSEGEANDD